MLFPFVVVVVVVVFLFFFFQAEDGIRDLVRSRGLGDVYKRQGNDTAFTVKILNPIDTFKLNIATIEFVHASHPVNLNWITYQPNMEFQFEIIFKE